jgi:hypothetical protein
MKVKIALLFALLGAVSVLSQDDFDPSSIQVVGKFFKLLSKV